MRLRLLSLIGLGLLAGYLGKKQLKKNGVAGKIDYSPVAETKKKTRSEKQKYSTDYQSTV